MKRLLSAFMVMVLCFTITVFPTEAANVSDLFYEIHDGQVTITDCDTSAQGTIVIPGTIDGYPVTKIGEYAFADCDSINTVHISGSVTTICDYAFYDCGVKSLHIFSGVTTIGAYAFARCFSLSSVYIPNTVTTIGDYAFYYCYSLTSVTIPDSVTHIGEGAFNLCSKLTSVTLPTGLTTIGDYLFYYCYDLVSVTIPQGVTAIGDYAFWSCGDLITVTIPDSVTTIGDNAFAYCSVLKSMTIPKNITSIGERAFYASKGFTAVTIPASLTRLGKGAFVSTRVKTIHFIGNAPEIVGSDTKNTAPFDGVYATAYYHADTNGWGSSSRQAFGENLTWLQSEHEYLNGICTICGDRSSAACTHSYAEGVWTTEPTCTTDGQKSYTCDLCGDIKYETFPATGHSMQTTDVAPSCTEEGYQLHVCESCHDTHRENITPPTGHRYENGVCTTCGMRIPGDVLCDGSVNILDVARLYSHVKGVAPLTDQIALQAADYTGDGVINILDVAGLYIHVKTQ